MPSTPPLSQSLLLLLPLLASLHRYTLTDVRNMYLFLALGIWYLIPIPGTWYLIPVAFFELFLQLEREQGAGIGEAVGVGGGKKKGKKSGGY